MDTKTRSNFLARVLVAAVFCSHAIGVKATYAYFAGYEPLTNVTRHSMIDLDLKDIMSGLGSELRRRPQRLAPPPRLVLVMPVNTAPMPWVFPTTDDAQCDRDPTSREYIKTNSPACSNSFDIWMHGKNSLKSTAVRNISKFSSGAATKGSTASIPYKNNAFISIMDAYWKSKNLNEFTWGFDMINAAFEGTQIGDLNFGTVGRTFRKEAIKKGLIYLNVYPYAIWEIRDMINDCRQGTSNDDSSVKAWDEAVAFWAGSQTRDYAYGAANDDDNFLYALGDKRCANFGTCATGFTGTAQVNQELLALFNHGKEQARSGNCDPIDNIHEKIGTMMMLPFIQGTIRYLYYTKDTQDAKSAGELWAFATAILPFLNEVNPAAAEALYKRAWLLDFSGSFEADKKLLESTYSQFGVGAGKGMITCSKIGDLYSDPQTMLSENTCTSSSSSDDAQKLALPLGLGLGAVCVVSIGLAAMFYSKERKVKLMYDDLVKIKAPPV